MTTFRRFVAIGDSSTEGLEDPDGHGGYRGWADRLAQHIADAQDGPLEYANLAIRGLRMDEIRTGQLADALAMHPDLLSVFGGMNDVIGPRPDFLLIRADYVIVFGEARRDGCDRGDLHDARPAAINPLGARLRDRVSRLNDIIRSEADRHGVIVMDFQAYPSPRTRGCGSRTGCTATSSVTASSRRRWRGGWASPGFDDSWAKPLEGPPPGCGRGSNWSVTSTGRCTIWPLGWARASVGCRTGMESNGSGLFPRCCRSLRTVNERSARMFGSGAQAKSA